MLMEQKLYMKSLPKKGREGLKGRIIIAKNESIYNVNKSCRGDVHSFTVTYTIDELIMSYNKKLKML